MIIAKVTSGDVVQKYDMETGKFISQTFYAENACYYEDEDGNPTDIMIPDDRYLPFDMVQPEG